MLIRKSGLGYLQGLVAGVGQGLVAGAGGRGWWQGDMTAWSEAGKRWRSQPSRQHSPAAIPSHSSQPAQPPAARAPGDELQGVRQPHHVQVGVEHVEAQAGDQLAGPGVVPGGCHEALAVPLVVGRLLHALGAGHHEAAVPEAQLADERARGGVGDSDVPVGDAGGLHVAHLQRQAGRAPRASARAPAAPAAALGGSQVAGSQRQVRPLERLLPVRPASSPPSA
jgi:hypothetical protein